MIKLTTVLQCFFRKISHFFTSRYTRDVASVGSWLNNFPFLWEDGGHFPTPKKIFINLPWNYGKLHCKVKKNNSSVVSEILQYTQTDILLLLYKDKIFHSDMVYKVKLVRMRFKITFWTARCFLIIILYCTKIGAGTGHPKIWLYKKFLNKVRH